MAAFELRRWFAANFILGCWGWLRSGVLMVGAYEISGTALGTLGLLSVSAAVQLLVTPLAPAVTRRISSRTVIRAWLAADATLALCLGVAAHRGWMDLWILLIFLVTGSFFQSLSAPAWAGYVLEHSDPAAGAGALFRTSLFDSGGRTVGLLALAVVTSYIPLMTDVEVSFFATGIGHVVVGGVVMLLLPRSRGQWNGAGRRRTRWVAGFALVRRRKGLQAVLLLWAGNLAFASTFFLLPSFVEQMGGDAAALHRYRAAGCVAAFALVLAVFAWKRARAAVESGSVRLIALTYAVDAIVELFFPLLPVGPLGCSIYALSWPCSDLAATQVPIAIRRLSGKNRTLDVLALQHTGMALRFFFYVPVAALADLGGAQWMLVTLALAGLAAIAITATCYERELRGSSGSNKGRR